MGVKSIIRINSMLFYKLNALKLLLCSANYYSAKIKFKILKIKTKNSRKSKKMTETIP